jgi:hypothetical protein
MLDALLRILGLVRKELLAILKDPRSRFALIGPPIIQCFIFGYAATYDLNHVPYAVLDQDRTAASRALLAKLDGSGVLIAWPICDEQATSPITSMIGGRSWSFRSTRNLSGGCLPVRRPTCK